MSVVIKTTYKNKIKRIVFLVLMMIMRRRKNILNMDRICAKIIIM